MTLPAGTRLGAYEVLSLVGSGGMGEVYRGRDTRLGREVAIKILPADVAADRDRLARFEQEARAAAALNHPNILVVFDVGAENGIHFVVSELLDGETLRDRIAGGAIPTRRATEYALQLAKGLAAAHEKGIVHRDLKPENVFVTRDERVKILDFGLAKLIEDRPLAGTMLPTTPVGTGVGTIVGTVGYMAPEQVRGQGVDSRVDIFAFGAILYELLANERAFAGASSADTISAILKEDPPHLAMANPARLANGGLQRIVQRCVEKDREQRFQSAHDLAFALEAVMGTASGSALAQAAIEPLAPAPRPGRRSIRIIAIAAICLGVGAIAGRRLKGGDAPVAAERPSFRQLTFTRGAIFGARFAPDGRTVVFSAGAARARLYLSRIDSVGTTPLPIEDARLFGVSPNAQLALGVGGPGWIDAAYSRPTTLVEAPLFGGSSRPMQEKVAFADWNPRGGDSAVVRVVGSREQLEFPPGRVLVETEGQIGYPRISPSGDRVAFLDWPVKDDDRGTAVIVDLRGKRTTISQAWEAIRGLAWTPDGAEVWYTAASAGTQYAIYAAGAGKPERRIYAAPSGLVLEDIGRDGKVLLSEYERAPQVNSWTAADAVDRNIAWLDFSFARDLSPDGSRVLLSSSGQGSSAEYDIYVCGIDGSGATKIGEGQPQQFSPDGRFVVAVAYGPPSRVVILAVGPGAPAPVPTGNVSPVLARWLHDGKRLLIVGAEPGRRQRAYVVDRSGGTPRPVSPEGITYGMDALPLAPDDSRVALRSPDGVVTAYPLAGGTPTVINGLAAAEMPVDWVEQTRVVVLETTPHPRLVRLDLGTGARDPLVDMRPSDPSLVLRQVHATPDGRAYVANYTHLQMTLFVADNMR